MKYKIETTPEFDKDLKKLSKKYASLKQDLENFAKFISGVDFENNKSYVILHREEPQDVLILKTRLMVRSLKGSSKVRLVFGCFGASSEICLIEIYLHGQQERESKSRIDQFLAGCKLDG